MNTKERILSMDILRVISCFAVVALHVSYSYWFCVDVGGRDFLVMTLYNSVTRFGVPVFFMLSGAFLLDPTKKLTIGGILKRVLLLAVSFYLWSFFYGFQGLALCAVRNGWDSITGEMWSNSFVRFLNGHGHMWFLMDLLGFYLLTPMLRKICEDLQVLGYFLLLWVVVRFVLTPLLRLCNLMPLFSVLNSLHLYSLMGFIGYYLGGYFLLHIQITRVARGVLYLCGGISLGMINLMTLISCRRTGTYEEHFLLPSNVLVLVFATSVFVFFAARQNREFSPGTRKVVRKLSGLTFFVYMAHPFFIEKLNLIGIRTISFSPILSIPVLTVAIFGICLLAGFIVKKIPVLGKLTAYQ